MTTIVSKQKKRKRSKSKKKSNEDPIIDDLGNTKLLKACVLENRKYIYKALDDPNCNINHINNEGDTALHVACRQNMYTVADKIIDHKNCKFDIRDGKTSNILLDIINQWSMNTPIMINIFKKVLYKITDVKFFEEKCEYGRTVFVAANYFRYKKLSKIINDQYLKLIFEQEHQNNSNKKRKVMSQLDDKTCCVCLEEIIQKHALSPCGHTQICVSCITQIENYADENDNEYVCPLCYTDIDDVLRIY
jgi:hypothetical protein